MQGTLLGVLCFSSLAEASDTSSCGVAASETERFLHIPEGFLAAMGRVESGRTIAGRVEAWPWTVTVEGQGHYYATKKEAIEAIELFQSQGMRSIDVGCLQINLQQHPEAFSSLEQALDPSVNAKYAGAFLVQMYERMGSWPRAAAAYHSQTPDIGTPYQWKVLEAWALPQNGQKSLLERRYSPHFEIKNAGRSSLYNRTTGHPPMASASDFHPFVGSGHYIPPPPVHRVVMRGRTLASYRASPVMLASPLSSR